jgi:DNA-binding HxlR family transcriptional regulator
VLSSGSMSTLQGSRPQAAICPVVATAQIVSGKWTLVLLRDLGEGPKRFTELQRSLAGISPRTLSVRLRVLEDEGILVRVEYAQTPPRVEYMLTDKGVDLIPIVDAMRDYGSRWLAADCSDAELLLAVAGE